jgi:hypothetical protein
MVEKEQMYNFAIIGVIAIIIMFIVYIFAFKPASDNSLTQKNFEESRNIFLAKYCENLKFKNFTIEDMQSKILNGYCFTQDNPMVRITSSFRLGYEKTDMGFTFFVLQEKK